MKQHYDVFLSYKQTDSTGEISSDKAMAEELYYALQKSGFSVFFSAQTLGIVGDAKYMEVITDALESAAILVAVGTCAENLNSNWVKFEWTSFINDVLSGRKEGQIFSFIDNMDPSDLPLALRSFQTFERRHINVESMCNYIKNALAGCQRKKSTVSPTELKIKTMKELEAEGVSAVDVAAAVTINDKNLYSQIPSECAGTADQWAEVFHRFPDFCAFLVDDANTVYGNFSSIGLSKEQEEAIRNGVLRESELDSRTADNLYVPGNHALYLMNLSVNPTIESAESYQALWQSYIDMIKEIAKQKIYFSRVYYKAFLPEHEARAAARGFRLLCDDSIYGKVFVHDMDPKGSLRALDEELAAIYSESVNSTTTKNELEIQTDVDAISAYMAFWKQIESLFYHPRYYRLQRFFFGSEKDNLPENSAEHQLGLVVAMLLRDTMQYSSALLPFLPKEQQSTYYQYEQELLKSALIKESMGQYRFSTEKGRLAVKISVHTKIAVDAIAAFANIWIDIDRLFMHSDTIYLRSYFYERKTELPPEQTLELGEGLAVRILTAMHISESLLTKLPREFADSYLDYKNEMLRAKLVERCFEKYPFLERELIEDI